jgi:hypothetical protein
VQTPHVTTSRSILANQRSSRLSQEEDVGVEMEPDAGAMSLGAPQEKAAGWGPAGPTLERQFSHRRRSRPELRRIQIEPDNVSGFGFRLNNVMDL